MWNFPLFGDANFLSTTELKADPGTHGNSNSIEAAKVTIGLTGIVVTGLKASGTAAVLLGGGVAVAVCVVAGGIGYVVIKRTFDYKKK